MKLELKSVRGLAPGTSEISLLQSNLRPCHRSELAIISSNVRSCDGGKPKWHIYWTDSSDTQEDVMVEHKKSEVRYPLDATLFVVEI